MKYKQTLEFLFSQLPMFQRIGAAAYKDNLDNTIALCNLLGNPQNDFPSIHIAGTNGKGSTANMLASVFQEAGYKTGLYTSPHLVDFRERIRINGQMIPEKQVIDFVETYSDQFLEIKPSFFEITFAMAIHHFSQQKVDVVIMETGMGGRLDSTNVVKSILSIITNIGFDHTAFLGNTLAEIAHEKAGIIKSKIPVIIGEKQDEIIEVFSSKAKELNAPISWAIDRVELRKNSDGEFNYIVEVDRKEWMKLAFPLFGDYQMMNLRTAVAAILNLQTEWKLSIINIKNGLENTLINTGFAGRWQVLQENPKIILDTGHNVEGMQYTMRQLKSLDYNKLHFVLGMVNDKDIAKVLQLLPQDASYYFCEADIPRALKVGILMEEAQKTELLGEGFSSVKAAYQSALKTADQEDIIFVGGSTFIVAEVLESLQN